MITKLLAMVVLLTMSCVHMQADNAALSKQVEEQATAVEYVDCGMCGAHVNQWWYVQSDDGQDLVEVCGYCYQLFREE